MILRRNMLICPFKLGNVTIRNKISVIADKMFNGISIVYRSNTIGYVKPDSVRVGSDGFYADCYLNDRYARHKFTFKKLCCNGIQCDKDQYLISRVSVILFRKDS